MNRRLLRGELRKLLTTRTLLAYALADVAMSLFNVVVVTVASGDLDELGEKQEALASLPILLLLPGLVGAAGEYRHRTAVLAVTLAAGLASVGHAPALVGRNSRAAPLASSRPRRMPF
jgi:ABC-2 type transport system permease protein